MLRKWGSIFEPYIKSGDLVLDVGGGVAPFERADVVYDLFTGSWAGRDIIVENGELIHDDPNDPTAKKRFRFVQGPVEKMPFKDKEFDFIFCSHTLEHVDDPALACSELTRVGKGGFIATPEIIKEGTFGDSHHVWFVHHLHPDLLIFFFKQDRFRPEKIFLGEMYGFFWNLWKNDPLFKKIVECTGAQHLQGYWNVYYFWKEKFRYMVIYEDGSYKTNII